MIRALIPHQRHLSKLRLGRRTTSNCYRSTQGHLERHSIEGRIPNLAAHDDVELGLHDELWARRELREERSDAGGDRIERNLRDVNRLVERMLDGSVARDQKAAAELRVAPDRNFHGVARMQRRRSTLRDHIVRALRRQACGEREW